MNNYFYEAFVKQDSKNYNFDAIFHVEGKELFAHRDVLAFVSPIFKALFIKNRPTPDNPINQPIHIDTYSYDDFYQFLRFIYRADALEDYDLDDDKLFPLIELAHIYQVNEVKEGAGQILACCGGFSAYHMEEELDDEDAEDIFERVEYAVKYSLGTFKDRYWIGDFLDKYLHDLLEYDDFEDLEKSAVEAFVTFVVKHRDVADINEELFKAVYKWGKHKAMVTVDTPEEESKEAIVHQLSDILPLFEFKNMSIKFLREFVVPKGLLSTDEARKYTTVEVCITSNAKTVTGTFVDGYGIYEYIIKSRKHYALIDHGEKKRGFWNKKFKHLSSPATVEKMQGCQWYLLFERNGKLNLKHHSLVVRTDYLLAEMKPKDGADFDLDKNHNAYATVSRKF